MPASRAEGHQRRGEEVREETEAARAAENKRRWPKFGLTAPSLTPSLALRVARSQLCEESGEDGRHRPAGRAAGEARGRGEARVSRPL